MIYFSGSMSKNSVIRVSSGDDQTAEFKEIRMLEWTTTPPTEPGCYWVMTGWGPAIAIVGSFDFSTNLMVKIASGQATYEISNFTHWLGPLPIPEPPE